MLSNPSQPAARHSSVLHGLTKLVVESIAEHFLSEGGIPLTGYLIPGCDGIWARTGSGVSVSLLSLLSLLSSSSSSSSKSSKIGKNAKRFLMMKHTLKKDWELLSTSYCTGFRCAAFWFSGKKSVFGPENMFDPNWLVFDQKSDFF